MRLIFVFHFSFRSFSQMKPLYFSEHLGSVESFRNLINVGRDAISYINLEVKFIYSEKATKILRNLPLTFDCMYCSQKLVEDFANFLWTSQNVWTLSDSICRFILLFSWFCSEYSDFLLFSWQWKKDWCRTGFPMNWSS